MKVKYMWFVGIISYSMESKPRRISTLLAYFFIKASDLLTQPDHIMFMPVMNYMYLRPSFKLNQASLLID